MSDYKNSVTIQAPAQAVFDFVSDPENMPEFLPTLKEAHAGEGDHIEMKGSVAGHDYRTTGEMHLDPDEREMHWGSDENSYRGQLKVTGDDSRSELSIRLDFHDDETERKIAERSPKGRQSIQDALVNSMDTIKRLCESGAPQKKKEGGYLG